MVMLGIVKEVRLDGPCPMDSDNAFILSEGPKQDRHFFISQKEERCEQNILMMVNHTRGRFRHMCYYTLVR